MPNWRCAAWSACLRPGRSWSWPRGLPRRGFRPDLRRGRWARVAPTVIRLAGRWSRPDRQSRERLPAGLGDARQFAPVRKRAEADPAEPELAIDGPRAPAARAPGVRADLKFRRALRLGDQSFLRHYSVLLERESE